METKRCGKEYVIVMPPELWEQITTSVDELTTSFVGLGDVSSRAITKINRIVAKLNIDSNPLVIRKRKRRLMRKKRKHH